MSVYLEIQSVHAREILDSRGNPTVGKGGFTAAGRRFPPAPARENSRQWSSGTGKSAIWGLECSGQ